MELEQRVKLARLIVALADDDREQVVSAYTAMGIRTKRMGKGGFRLIRVEKIDIHTMRVYLRMRRVSSSSLTHVFFFFFPHRAIRTVRVRTTV